MQRIEAYVYACLLRIRTSVRAPRVEGRGSIDTRFDKVLSIRDEKVDPLLRRIYAWDCHSSHESPLAFPEERYRASNWIATPTFTNYASNCKIHKEVPQFAAAKKKREILTRSSAQRRDKSFIPGFYRYSLTLRFRRIQSSSGKAPYSRDTAAEVASDNDTRY